MTSLQSQYNPFLTLDNIVNQPENKLFDRKSAGFLLMGNINGELYFGVAQNESGYKWFKLTGATAL